MVDASDLSGAGGLIGTGAMLGGPVGAGIGGVAALISTILDSQAKGAGANLAARNLQNQEANAAQEYRLGTATRQDAYGNTEQYDPVTNTWRTNLTPTQKELTTAGEREQLQSLTHDAQQNREVRDRAFQRGTQANDDYARTNADFKYGNGAVPSEGSIRDQLTDLLTGSAQGASSRAMRSASAMALRGGPGTRMPNAEQTSEDLGSQLSDILLKAREGALSERAQRASTSNSTYLPQLQALQQTAEGGGNAPIDFSQTPQMLMSQQGGMVKDALSAINSGGTLENAASKNASDLLAKSGPDLKGIASLISATGKLGGSGSSGGGDTSGDDIPDSAWSNLADQFKARNTFG